MKTILAGTYELRDIADARKDRDRLRRDCHDAVIKVGGNLVFLYVKEFIK